MLNNEEERKETSVNQTSLIMGVKIMSATKALRGDRDSKCHTVPAPTAQQ